jgi:uncharacterized membrane protein YheB (UPF0754 family)
MVYDLLIGLLVGGGIGYLAANFIVKALFRPIRPFTRQGLIPARWPGITQSLAATAASHVPFDALTEKLTNPELVARLHPIIETHIDKFLREKLSVELPMISMFIGDKTIDKVKTALMKEIDDLLPQVLLNYTSNLKADLNVEAIIAKKLDTLDLATLESALKSYGAQPIRAFQWAGAGIGLLAAALQWAISALLA